MEMKGILEEVTAGGPLTRERACEIMSQLMEGRFNDIEIGGFLVALKTRGETAEEIAGFVDASRGKHIPLEIDATGAVDSAGTGGDGSGSFNISTAAALVAASAGARVAKHGNRSVSSRCGSADLLERVGVNIDPGPEAVSRDFERLGICFMFAPRFYPAFKYAGPARKALGVRTVFNMLGPLLNPARVRRQLVGVYSPDILELLAESLLALGCERALVVNSRDGLDEISAAAPTDCIELDSGTLKRLVIDPHDLGLPVLSKCEETGGPDENEAILLRLLSGEPTAAYAATLANSGALLYLAGCADSICAGVKLAGQAIESGRAGDLLHRWTGLDRSTPGTRKGAK